MTSNDYELDDLDPFGEWEHARELADGINDEDEDEDPT